MKKNILYLIFVLTCVVCLILSVTSFKDYYFFTALGWFIALAGVVIMGTIVITKYVHK